MRRLDLHSFPDGILVLAPHQDDEVLLAGGLLSMLQQAGVPVHVTVVTNGDCGCRDKTKGQTRLRETLQGMAVLGLSPEQVSFLGYADTGMPMEESFLQALLRAKGDVCLSSPCSDRTYGLPEKEDYHFEKTGEHAYYTRQNFLQDLFRNIREVRPTAIFTTAERDVHGDHAAMIPALRRIRAKYPERAFPQVYCGIVHSAEGDASWPLRSGDQFTPPRGLWEEMGLSWEDRMVLPLGRTEEKKRRALLQYPTALEPEAAGFLLSFVKKEELFWSVAMEDENAEQ